MSPLALKWTPSISFSAGDTIDCFDCNSWDDPRCHDPWNWTYPKVVHFLVYFKYIWNWTYTEVFPLDISCNQNVSFVVCKSLFTLFYQLLSVFTQFLPVFTCFSLCLPIFTYFLTRFTCFSTICHPPLPVRVAVSRWSSSLGPTTIRSLLLLTETTNLEKWTYSQSLWCQNCPVDCWSLQNLSFYIFCTTFENTLEICIWDKKIISSDI